VWLFSSERTAEKNSRQLRCLLGGLMKSQRLALYVGYYGIGDGGETRDTMHCEEKPLCQYNCLMREGRKDGGLQKVG
jgi:hypothetical protein